MNKLKIRFMILVLKILSSVYITDMGNDDQYACTRLIEDLSEKEKEQ